MSIFIIISIIRSPSVFSQTTYSFFLSIIKSFFSIATGCDPGNVSGQLGETYNVGGWNEKTNLDVVNTICSILDELRPKSDRSSYASQITYVKDRPGHDRRYAIDATKLERELGWKPVETFDTGIRKTVQWYLDNQEWTDGVLNGSYRDWLKKQYK